jgi:hypothetical protein
MIFLAKERPNALFVYQTDCREASIPTWNKVRDSSLPWPSKYDMARSPLIWTISQGSDFRTVNKTH